MEPPANPKRFRGARLSDAQIVNTAPHASPQDLSSSNEIGSQTVAQITELVNKTPEPNQLTMADPEKRVFQTSSDIPSIRTGFEQQMRIITTSMDALSNKVDVLIVKIW